MARKPGPVLCYLIGIRGADTRFCIHATCWTAARKKLAAYQRQHGGAYYLKNPMTHAPDACPYCEVLSDVPAAPRQQDSFHPASAQALKKQDAHLRRYNVD